MVRITSRAEPGSDANSGVLLVVGRRQRGTGYLQDFDTVHSRCIFIDAKWRHGFFNGRSAFEPFDQLENCLVMVSSNNTLNIYIRAALIAVPLIWVLAASLPEIMRDRIFPFDSALIAANGGLFLSLFSEFGEFLTAPMDWLWAYYDQYPALSVRRHPPLFGLVAGLIYSVVGVSTSAAKLTVMLFALGFSLGVFFVARRMFGGYLLAACATLLVVATPQIALHFRSVWLDVPSLAFAIWVFNFYLARLDGDKSLRNVLGMVLFTVLALYTYQPTVVLLGGLFAHWLLNEWRTFYKEPPIWIGVAVLVLLMLPLVAFTVYFAKDNLLATTGVIPEQWKEFASPTYADWIVTDKLTLAYWFDYAGMIAVSYPFQLAGLFLWVGLRFTRKPAASEMLMLVCVVVTYVAFSWLIVKGHRYTLYMMIPASLLTVAALRDLFVLLARERVKSLGYAATAVLVGSLLQTAFVSAYAPYDYLSGFGVPVTRIFDEKADANILYSGRADAAFVFYARSLDEGRQANVRRASVQLADPGALESYVRSEEIDFIVVEIDNPGYDTLEVIDRFREAILAFVGGSGEFVLQSEHRLPFGEAEEEGTVLLHVYERRR